MHLLEVSGARFSYGEVEVLRGVDLTVARGEIVALVGANGAGKTTLINSISGFNRLSSGSVLFEGEDIATLSPHELPARGLIQVPENRHLFPYLSVEDNLALGAYSRAARASSQQRREQGFEFMPVLAAKRRQRAGSLSGGQQQMLAIGRAAMGKPRLLMLDEPSLGLAPIVVSQLFALLERIRDEEQTAMLIVEQNVSRALELADRAYAIQGGRIRLSGPADSFADAPQFRELMLGMAPDETSGAGA